MRIGKNRKNKYPQIFLPTHLALWWMCNHKLRDVCHFGTCIIILFWSFLPFFTSFPCHHELAKVTFDDIDRWSFTSKRKLCSYRITGARCTIWHFSQIYTRAECEDYIAANSVQALPHLLGKWILKLSVYLGCAKSQKLARLREIAKINTRKIIGTQKSQNFVLANNRTPPLEAILVIFGRRALIFFLFESSWKKMKNDATFVRMRSGDHLGDAKMSKKGTSLRRI